MYCNYIAVLYPQIVSNNSIDTSAAIIQFIIREYDEDGVFSLFALDKNGVAAKELECLHRVVRQSDDGVIIAGGIGNTMITC